jgi:WD40 repeat protein
MQFDYLKSLEIEEKINKIKWCQTANGALFLLSTNDKTIKFWKVQYKIIVDIIFNVPVKNSMSYDLYLL